jgi:hypothetical protein
MHGTKSHWIRRTFLIVLVFAVVLAGCRGGEPAAPTAQPTAAGTSAPALSTNTPRPRATATPTPTEAPTATVVPTPPGLMTEFPPDVNPLTGEKVSDPAVLNRRPLAIKVSNSPPIVRPQAGLSFADLVFEHYAEGGVTRFTAVFLTNDVQKVGSVRSCRLIDLEIPAMYKSALAFSGASAGVKQKVRQSDFFDRAISPDFGIGAPVFVRIPNGKPLEHTMFTSTDQLWNELDKRGLNGRQDLKGMAFMQTPPPGGQPATQITIAYRATTATWRYDTASGRYLRWDDGAPHTDELTGQQLSAANVVVVWANHVETDILEDSFGGGHYSIQIQIWGEGPVRIFRDGQMYEGKWVRQRREDMLSFVDQNGDPWPLKPGNSWFQLISLDGHELKYQP